MRFQVKFRDIGLTILLICGMCNFTQTAFADECVSKPNAGACANVIGGTTLFSAYESGYAPTPAGGVGGVTSAGAPVEPRPYWVGLDLQEFHNESESGFLVGLWVSPAKNSVVGAPKDVSTICG